MADYAKLYWSLFTAITRAIEFLQEAQQVAEDIYISSPDPDIRLVDPSQDQDDNGGEE